MLSREDRLAGAVWGHLVGDALGVPYEGREPEAVGSVAWGERGSHGQPPGTWSDDGALMLATLESLLETGFDPADLARSFLAWADDGAYTPDGDGAFDIGGTTGRALAALRRGADPETAGPAGERDQGNGSLMRILPIALTATEPQVQLPELVSRAHRASGLTHGHATCRVTCAVYVVAARDLLRGDPDPERVLAAALGRLRLVHAGDPALAEAQAQLEAWPRREGRGGVLDAFWSAWDAFAGAGSYADAVECAIRYGHDTDTTAAIAGGLAGLRFGLRGIPAEWRDGMRGRDLVEPLVARLVAYRSEVVG